MKYRVVEETTFRKIWFIEAEDEHDAIVEILNSEVEADIQESELNTYAEELEIEK